MRKLLAILFFLVPIAHATCSGSGTTWSCTAGSTSAQIQTAVNSATDGFTITLANGSYTLSSMVNFSNTVGGTIICASVGGCTINYTTNTVFGALNLNGVNTHFYRISGFIFDAGGNGPFATLDWDDGLGGTVSTPGPNGIGGIRIDHNTFQNMATGSNVIFFGDTASIGNYYGVIDHNTIHTADIVVGVQYIGLANPSPPSNQLGTVNNMFIEDNTFTFDAMSNASNGACTDGWAGVGYVVRHNTSLNCLWAVHGSTHAGGPANYEIYNNTISLNSAATGESPIDCYRCFHHQGSGTFAAFNNTFSAPTGPNVEVISMLHYRDYGPPPSPNGSIDNGTPFCDGTVASQTFGNITYSDGNRSTTATNRGYPCWHQPGRDFQANIVPMYAWNNIWQANSSQISLLVPDAAAGSPDYFSNHMQADREWFNAVSASAQSNATTPFNGTTGMGFGTLARRPTTCTSQTAENALGHGTSGVGYFATDQGAQGTLYQCTATNTWSVYYTPYTYPHPLVGGGSATAPSCAPLGGPVPQTVTCTNPNTGTTVACYRTDGTDPATSGDGINCPAGSTKYTGPVLASTPETFKIIAGTSVASDSSVVTYQFTLGITPATALFAQAHISTTGQVTIP